MVILRLRRPKTAEPPTIPHLNDTLFDLLNRDQRTIITIKRKSRSPKDAGTDVRFNRSSHLIDISKTNLSDDGFKTNFRSRYHREPRRRFNPNQIGGLLHRLGEVFIVGVCLLTLVRVPTVMSAPSTRHAKETEQILSHEPTEETRTYLHPCWISPEEAMNNSYYKMASEETNPDILKNIIILAKNALAYAEGFRDRYVEETFNLRFERQHSVWESEMYEWLPNESNGIPKRLGNKLNPLHVKSKTLDEFLVNIYEHMQKFAVALEQIVIDQKRTQGKFRENFRMMEYHLRNILCEIREGMMERNIAPREQVPRSIMEDRFRYLQYASQLNVRDWLIFRDLMNGLEYVIEVFTFIDNLPQESAIASS